MSATTDKLKRISKYFRPHVSSIVVSLLCTVLIGAVTAATAWLVKPVLDDVFIKNDSSMLSIIPFAVVLLYFVKGVCTFGQGYMMNRVAQNVIMQVRNDVLSHIQSREMAYFDKTPTGSIVNRVISDVSVMQNSVPVLIIQVRQYISMVGLVGVLFSRDWLLATIAVIVLPMIALPVKKIGERIKQYSRKTQKSSDVLSRLLIETFQGVEVVKGFNWQGQANNRFLNQSKILLDMALKRGAMNNVTAPTVEFFGAIGAALIIWWGGREVLLGHTTPGNFFSFMAAFFMVYDPLKRIGQTSNQIQQAMVSAERVFEIMDVPPAECETSGKLELSASIDTIEFKDVAFSYPTRPDSRVLNGVSFKAEHGQVIALVGDSGGGKSTVLKLLPRFYSPETGEILINGVDIREYRVESLRERMAIVNQSPFLFDDTVRSNIEMGRPGATEEEIIDAARSAFAHNFVTGLSEGYQTRVGERGDQLSGGQKQRISIARAILRDSPILILDEATSALDSEAEKEIQIALSSLMKGRTTFVIAHRLSTIMHADQIIFIKEGRVTEVGTHAELIAKNGDYARLCRIQFGEG